ncbi:MAG: F0F1 ATP synthase subunit B [Desulfobacterales bacterium]|nr:F0F1 ATP synthase subunit B [Desulfobacterales bacterium]
MLIDWFTVVAQVINFLILVWLLKRFLYGPIMRAMDKREEKIASRLEKAENKRREAEQEAQDFRQKNVEFDGSRQAMLLEAKEEANDEKKALTNEIRNEIQRMRTNWYEAIDREKAEFLQELRRRTVRQTWAVARRALMDLASADLEQRMVDLFVERIQKLKEDELETLRKSAGQADYKAQVRTAFEIPHQTAQKIVNAFRNQVSDRIDVQFETYSDLICGIESKVHGHKIAWSLDDYLGALEESLIEALEGWTKVEESKASNRT